MIKTLRAVVFDLDGVLIDSEQANVDSACLTLRSLDIEMSGALRQLIVGRHPIVYLPELAERAGIDPDRVPGLLQAQNEIYQRFAPKVQLNPGVKRSLRWLHDRSLRLAVATASDRACAEEVLARHGVRDAFEFVLTRESVGNLKPDPEVYELSLDRLGLKADEVAVVEDSGHGVRAARAAGIFCIAVKTPWVASSEIAEADAHIDSLDALPALLEEFVRPPCAR